MDVTPIRLKNASTSELISCLFYDDVRYSTKLGAIMEDSAIVTNRRKNLACIAVKSGGKSALAFRLGKTPQQIGGMINGQKSFGDKVARDIETQLGLSRYSLDQEVLSPTGHLVHTVTHTTSSHPECLSITALELRKDYALINPPKLGKIRLMQFEGDWLYEQSVATSDPHSLKLLSATGDNMEPLIAQGSAVIVDISQRALNTNGIFALSYSGSIFIHRVQIQPGGKYILLSDNHNYQPMHIESLDDIIVIGRCIIVNNTQAI